MLVRASGQPPGGWGTSSGRAGGWRLGTGWGGGTWRPGGAGTRARPGHGPPGAAAPTAAAPGQEEVGAEPPGRGRTKGPGAARVAWARDAVPRSTHGKHEPPEPPVPQGLPERARYPHGCRWSPKKAA